MDAALMIAFSTVYALQADAISSIDALVDIQLQMLASVQKMPVETLQEMYRSRKAEHLARLKGDRSPEN